MIHSDSLRSLYSGHEAHQSAEHVRLLYWIQNGTLPFSAALLGFSLVQSLLSRERVAMGDQSHDTPNTQPAHHGQDAVSSLPLQPAKLEVEIKCSWFSWCQFTSNVDSGFKSLSCHHLPSGYKHGTPWFFSVTVGKVQALAPGFQMRIPFIQSFHEFSIAFQVLDAETFF